MEKKVQLAILCGSPENCQYQTGVFNDECSSKESRNCPYANHQDSFRQSEKGFETV